MSAAEKIDFGGEVSKMMPVIIKKATSNQMVLLSKEGLTFPQVIILDLLREKSPSKMGEVAKALNLTMSAATGIIDKMIELKLVDRERSQEDRRIVFVSLAKKGGELAKEISEARKRSANELFSALEENEKQEYLRLLRKIYDSIKKTG